MVELNMEAPAFGPALFCALSTAVHPGSFSGGSAGWHYGM
jgi:hypothetical protein